jgi:hypothetical protein
MIKQNRKNCHATIAAPLTSNFQCLPSRSFPITQVLNSQPSTPQRDVTVGAAHQQLATRLPHCVPAACAPKLIL